MEWLALGMVLSRMDSRRMFLFLIGVLSGQGLAVVLMGLLLVMAWVRIRNLS